MIVRCHGCGWTAPSDDPWTFRCANAGIVPGDDVDHLLTIVDDHPARDRSAAPPDPSPSSAGAWRNDDPNPFVRYRHRLYSHDFALRHGLSDEGYVGLVDRLDDAVAAVDGRGFRITPFGLEPALSRQLGVPILVKDETGNVSGSHKARHLMGIMIHLLVAEALRGRGKRSDACPRLAIASCGNAALGAAVVARAASWPLEVFVPPWADATVVEGLNQLGATITRCPRLVSDPPGDPCVHRFREAVASGAIPFGCQGPDNGLTIDGGRTLGWELAEQRALQPYRRLCIQVGGGALASSVVQGLRVGGPLPLIHPVQTEGCAPLVRAWQRSLDILRGDPSGPPGDAVRPRDPAALQHLARQRSRVMWPWETEPHSAALGILDDETYDWWEIVAATDASGGRPLVATEDDVTEALRLARSCTAIPVDATGSAGLAGLLRLLTEEPALRGAGEPIAVLFTGIDRSAPSRPEPRDDPSPETN
jgi:threonine synthase